MFIRRDLEKFSISDKATAFSGRPPRPLGVVHSVGVLASPRHAASFALRREEPLVFRFRPTRKTTANGAAGIIDERDDERPPALRTNHPFRYPFLGVRGRSPGQTYARCFIEKKKRWPLMRTQFEKWSAQQSVCARALRRPYSLFCFLRTLSSISVLGFVFWSNRRPDRLDMVAFLFFSVAAQTPTQHENKIHPRPVPSAWEGTIASSSLPTLLLELQTPLAPPEAYTEPGILKKPGPLKERGNHSQPARQTHKKRDKKGRRRNHVPIILEIGQQKNARVVALATAPFFVLCLARKIRRARLYKSARPMAVIYALPAFLVDFVAPQLYESALTR